MSKRKSPPLSLLEWILIHRMNYEGKSFQIIAKKLSRPMITIKRAVNRFPIPSYLRYQDWEKYGHYCWVQSNENRSKSRSGRFKLKNDFIKDYVKKKLKDKWCPANIAIRLPLEHPEHSICTESIYAWIYLAEEGSDYIQYLVRGGKKKRQGKAGSRTIKARPSKSPDKISIDHRPESANNRTCDGAVETDLILGSGRSCLLVVVNRKTRRIWLRKIKSKESMVVYWALLGILRSLPEEERRTLTTDNGTEFALWQDIEHLMGIWIYFCHAYCSFEKGTIENRNGVVRNRFFKKGTNFDDVSHEEVREAERWINDYPMLIHKGYTPLEIEARCRELRKKYEEENWDNLHKLAA